MLPRLALLTTAALILAGCSAPATSTTPAATLAAPTTAAPTTAAQTTDAAPSSTEDATPAPTTAILNTGGKATVYGGGVTVELLQAKAHQVSDRDAPSWIGLARLCNLSVKDHSIEPSWNPWAVLTADGEQYQASDATYTGDPRPAYPFMEGDRILKPGDCAKGWIVFEITKGAKITQVEYTNGIGDRVTWNL